MFENVSSYAVVGVAGSHGPSTVEHAEARSGAWCEVEYDPVPARAGQSRQPERAMRNADGPLFAGQTHQRI